ncbi:hypothetical protein LTZ18_04300 [Lacticaseibacillus rhamnosus]|nr:hypothetical protein [Lacticaseibacillus rhamnosus]
MLDTIFAAISNVPRIKELAGNRIFKYEFPESADHSQLRIVITPLSPPHPSTAGSDDPLSLEFTYQINVESLNRKQCKEVQHLISNVMRDFSFAQMTGGLDEWLNPFFVDARRYRGNSALYDTNY